MEITWPIEYLQKIVNFAAKQAKFFALFSTILMWFFGLLNIIVSGTLTMIINYLSSLDLSQFQGANFSNLDYIGYINSVFPVTEFLLLSVGYAAATGILILIRWAKSFIPTLSN